MRASGRKTICFFIIALLYSSLTPLTFTQVSTSLEAQHRSQREKSICLVGNVTNLSIDAVKGGLGVTFTLRNTGSVDLANIHIELNVSKSFFIRVKTNMDIVPALRINESIDIPIQVFGISLGILRPYPELTICVTTPENIEKKVQVTTKVIGFFTKIMNIFFMDEAFNGYTLFSPEYSTMTYLMDKQGNIAHSWESQFIQGLGLSLLENGNLLRTVLLYDNPVFISGGVTGGVELFDWNGTRLWQYNYSTTMHCLHHSFEVLPNGNILLVGWEFKSAAEAIAAGRDPSSLPLSELWPDHVIEVEPTGSTEGTIVWEWHIWDHLIQDFDPTKENYGVVKEHPELLDINYGIEDANKIRADWNHINSIDYNKQFDQIVLSARHQNEIWIIDHSTTTPQAAGHTGGRSGKGGDLLYRYGNPKTYEAGDVTDQRFFGQHDAQWISEGYPGAGHLLVFNNGEGRPQGQYSTVEELLLPVDENGSYYLEPNASYGPDEPVWTYTAENPYDFFAGYLSSTQRLPNGNTLICDGDHGIFFEVTVEKKTVWIYHNNLPSPFLSHVFKVLCYAPDYPGLRNLYL